MEHLMKIYPKMYRVWLTKHVSGCCGTNKQMSYWKPGWSAMCPSCGSVVERTSHVTRCREPGRKKMLHSSVGELVNWVYETTDDYDMAMSLSRYLMSQGDLTFQDAGPDSSSATEDHCVWTQLVKETDGLGWDCLLEGKVSKQWILFARTSLERTGNPMSPEGWTRRFINKLIQITHQQWIYRNYKVHFRTKGGLTVKEHDDCFDRFGELMYTDPDELLPQHQHLLLMNPAELGEGPLADKQVWIVKMEAARLAKEKVDERRSRGFDRTELEQRVAVDGGTRESEGH
jgi:hypothetical protein